MSSSSQIQIQEVQKNHLEYFVNQPTKILQDVLRDISSGKILNESEITEKSQATEALTKVLIDAKKLRLSEKEFSEQLKKLVGFSNEHLTHLCNFFTSERSGMNYLNSDELSFRDLEWRLEAKIASRSSNSLPADPKITIKLHLDREKSLNHRLILSETNDRKEELVLQTDPNNLLHIIDQLEAAKMSTSVKKAAS